MIQNSTEIQSFLDSAKADIKSSGENCSIQSFEKFRIKKYAADDTGFSTAAFLGDVSLLLSHNQVTYYKELTSYKSKFAKLVLPVKRIIRKLVAFLFLPVVAEQNEINLNTARLFTHLRCYINKNNHMNEESFSDTAKNELQSRDELISRLSAQVEELSERVSQLESKGGEKK